MAALMYGLWNGVHFFLQYPQAVKGGDYADYTESRKKTLPGLGWLAAAPAATPVDGTRFMMSRAHRALDLFGSRAGLGTAMLVGFFWVVVFDLTRTPALWNLLSLVALATLGAMVALALGWIWDLLGWHYRTGEPAVRAKVSWIFFSVLIWGWIVAVGFFAAWLIGIVGFIMARADLGVESVRLAGLIAAFGPPSLVLLFVFSLALSVFYKGAVDPRLAIRRTTMLGLTALVLTALVVGLESFVASHFAAWLKLPAHTGTAFAGVTVALCFGPMRRRYETKVDRLVDRMLPASALAEADHYRTTVVFADLSGYTALSERNQTMALTLASLLHKESRRLAEQGGGRLVKTIGDAGLYDFPRPVAAVEFCLALRTQFAKTAQGLGLEVLPLHFGAHLGEVVRARDGDLFGATVNLSARLQSLAGNGEIVISDVVALELPVGRFNLELMGPQTLKNVQEPVISFRVEERSTKHEILNPK